ncbi:MAG: ABC transporter ATP-binding protein [Deltaproteobacteria bacterium]|nr:MAG: ABC transporter ATP-binding protein [Deltaproteobacteria bacterium]
MPSPTSSEPDAAVQVRGLVRSFGAVRAVAGLDLALYPGEIYGLVGPDGAGKTTTIRTIAGLLDPDAGTVRVLGLAPDDPRVRESVGLMPQRYSLYGDLSVGENLRFFRRLFCLPRDVAEQRIARLLALTRLAPFIDRRADDLSGGMYKKLALACALLHQPRVLLLDEPTNGVDPVSRRELWTLLGEFVGQGMAVLVSTPTMDEAERCHRVGLLHAGRLIAEGEPSRLVRELDSPVFLVRGGDRDRVQAVVEQAPEVLAASPAGARLKVVLQPGGTDRLAERLAPHGATLVPTRPDFEDLFLARLAAGGTA